MTRNNQVDNVRKWWNTVASTLCASLILYWITGENEFRKELRAMLADYRGTKETVESTAKTVTEQGKDIERLKEHNRTRSESQRVGELVAKEQARL